MSPSNLSPINNLSNIYSARASAKTEKSSEMAQFSQLFMSMFSDFGGEADSSSGASLSSMMSSLLGGNSYSSSETSMGKMMPSLFGGGSDSTSSTSMSSMIMPLMLNLLEKMQSLQTISEIKTDTKPVSVPVEGGVLTQEYNAGHHALDFGIIEGTPVKTTMAGKVIHSGWNDQGYGNLVIVENGSRRTYYAHLSELPVTQGDWVNQGDVIGLSGNTGNSTGPHLHYEVRVNGVTVDPSGDVFGNNDPII